MSEKRIDIPSLQLPMLLETASFQPSRRLYASRSSILSAMTTGFLSWIAINAMFAPTCIQGRAVGPPRVALEWKPLAITATVLLILAVMRITYHQAAKVWLRAIAIADAVKKDVAIGVADVTHLDIGQRHLLSKADPGLFLLVLPVTDSSTALLMHRCYDEAEDAPRLKTQLRIVTLAHTGSIIHVEFSGAPVTLSRGPDLVGSRLDTHLRDELASTGMGAVVPMPFDQVARMLDQRAPAAPSRIAQMAEALSPASFARGAVASR